MLNYISQIFLNDVDFVLKVARVHSEIDITPYIKHFKVFNNPEFVREAIYLPNIRAQKIVKCRVLSKHLPLPAVLDLLFALV